MPQILRTPQAATDLLEIWVYIAEESSLDAASRGRGEPPNELCKSSRSHTACLPVIARAKHL